MHSIHTASHSHCVISGAEQLSESSMGYDNDPYRDETANQLCTLMRIYNQIGRNLLDFGMDDEDNMAGRVKVRWKERRSVEKKQRATIAGTGSDSEAEESEDGEEINELFKVGKKIERIVVEIELVLENVMTALEVVAEEDAELNQLVKPTINKLKKLSHLTNVLSKKQLQHEFLDHGVLSLLKNWPEPLPVGSLPNINVRVAVLKMLDDLPIDLKQHHQREQLKKSGLGKVIMFLSKSDEETTANRKLAKELVDKWCRPIFNKSTRLEGWKVFDEERVPTRPPVKKVASNGAGMSTRDDQLVSIKNSQGSKAGESSSRQNASRPKPVSMDFVVRPPSQVDPVAARIRAEQKARDQPHIKGRAQSSQKSGSVVVHVKIKA